MHADATGGPSCLCENACPVRSRAEIVTSPLPIRRAAGADAADLARLTETTFTETFGHLYPPEDLAEYVERVCSPAACRKLIEDPEVAIWLVGAAEAQPAGCSTVAANCKLPVENLEPNAGEIRQLYVLSTHQNLRLGARLMDVALGWLAEQSCSPLYIGVWSENQGAQRFYGRYGFVKVGEYGFPVGKTVDHEVHPQALTFRGSRMPSIRELNIYPLKSGRAVPLTEARLGVTGFEWDRHWMAASPEGVFMSQRTQPRLALIEPTLSNDILTLRAPDQQPLHISAQGGRRHPDARVWKDSITALDQGDPAADWLTRAVGSPARLLRISPILDRRANTEFAGTTPAPVSFADGFPILVCNSASLEELNSRMPEPVPMERFRPNIVIDGLEPFEEDRIGTIDFGHITLRLVKPCTRCVITSTDQRTGQPATNPLPILRTFRFNKALIGCDVRGERCHRGRRWRRPASRRRMQGCSRRLTSVYASGIIQQNHTAGPWSEVELCAAHVPRAARYARLPALRNHGV